MKLYILRHGQAEAMNSSDFERRLTSEGIADVQALGAKLKSEQVSINKAFVSPYVRTQQTFRSLKNHAGLAVEPQTLEMLTPDGAIADVFQMLAGLAEDDHVLLVTHQPLVSKLVACLVEGSVKEAYQFPMNPASLAEVDIDADAVYPGNGTLPRLISAPYFYNDSMPTLEPVVNKDAFEERDLRIREMTLRVKLWHEKAETKVIALHGWLDNAASFDVLAPQLDRCAIAAIDQAGVGFSQFRSKSSTYHLWDDVLDVLDIADALGWHDFIVLGHSRGAMLAIMLAAAAPTRVKQLMLIDGLLPLPVEAMHAATQMQNYVNDYRRPQRAKKKTYKTREEAIALRIKAANLPIRVATLLAQRNLKEEDGEFYWHVDNRLKAASALKLTHEHNVAFLSAVNCAIHVVVAKQGMGAYDKFQTMMKDFPWLYWHHMDGHHHLHMDEQAKEIATLCKSLWL